MLFRSVSVPVRGLILLAWHTGARMGELVIMRWADIDARGSTWWYRPSSHKTAWKGGERTIAIGPKGQEVLQAYRQLDPAEFIFRPEDATWWKNKAAGHYHYGTGSVSSAVKRACARAGLAHWHPHQLRHAFATRVAAVHGLAVAQVLLGHSHPTTTAVYAARDQAVAERVMADF